MTTIKTTWGKIFENERLVLFNNYPEILDKAGDYEELHQWVTNEEDNEIYQWYLIPSDGIVDWLRDFCPEIYEDVHYSDTIGYNILAVRHFGMGWDTVPATLEMDDKAGDLIEYYQKIYHDDLPEWIKKCIL